MTNERKTESEMIPLKFYLSQNYPNPFKYKTSIKYCIAYRTLVDISVFNMDGHMIRNLINTEQNAGTYEIEFSAEGLNEGQYFYQITAGEYFSKKKMSIN